ncbi:MAG: DUF4235 domain-containing protein [Gemmatimonadaceae bacterium]|nr:DUF4235 domain-containing protein [Gemmatimonadaceae bacterium]MDQ3242426.1 DUF4235 domain-containing protein [Gemmatimonadota bacterium]
MNRTTRKAAWMIVGAASAMLAKALIERGMETGWRAFTDDDAPDEPESPDTSWKDALLWTAASALAVGVGQLVAKRGAAIGWEHATGKEPPA